MKRQSQQGIALVITLILLSVITFMTVTFLVVSRHEGEQVDTMSQQNISRMAAIGIEQQAEAQIISDLMAAGTGFTNLGLRVSTNFQTQGGYDPTPAVAASVYDVGYTYANGQPLSTSDQQQMLNNLLFQPRVPVFISTNKNQPTSEFRYYVDENGNGMFDTNGLITNSAANGQPIQIAGVYQTNVEVGDPEWVGFLDHPDQRHSASNLFLSRGAYIAIPIGDALDANAIHNQSKFFLNAGMSANPSEGFLRNQGVGSGELNFAAFLAVVNTNVWGWQTNLGYTYNWANPAQRNLGFAFNDAAAVMQYRNGGNYNNLNTFANLFGNGTVNSYLVNGAVDAYAVGPLMTGVNPPTPNAASAFPWSGANNPVQLVRPRDLVTMIANPSGASLNSFTNRLNSAGTNLDTYDRYTFYHVLAQMGFSSAPEPAPYPVGGGNQPNISQIVLTVTPNMTNWVNGRNQMSYGTMPEAYPYIHGRKMNLNYNNITSTNFTPWANAAQFFTNAADRLLRAYYPTNFAVMMPNGKVVVTNINVNFIPIYPVNYYTPGVHRALQLAANIYDASTNKNASGFDYPSVFRPIFNKTGKGANSFVYISGYYEISNNAAAYQNAPLDLRRAVNGSVYDVDSLVNQDGLNNDFLNNVFGIPYVIGARTNLPNFNQFSMAPVVQITRSLVLGRSNGVMYTNISYAITVSNVAGIQCWNSYNSNYARGVKISATDDFSMTITNTLLGPVISTNAIFGLLPAYTFANPVPITPWPNGVDPIKGTINVASFAVPMLSNAVLLAPGSYQMANGSYTTNAPISMRLGRVPLTGSYFPEWGVNVTNRVRLIIQDVVSGRIIDYVQLGGVGQSQVGLDSQDGLVTNMSMMNIPPGNDLWNTNIVSTNNPLPVGLFNQYRISVGGLVVDKSLWANSPSGANPTSIQTAISGFNNFLANTNDPGPHQMPFVVSTSFKKVYTWGANDPLVHYTVGDLTDLTKLGTNNVPQPLSTTNLMANVLTNLNIPSPRYQPWNTANSFTLLSNIKGAGQIPYRDPMIRRSADWSFPSNKYPNIGWLGRVHRGTPWQTVYLKSTAADVASAPYSTWQMWTGNMDRNDSVTTQPTSDWALLDLFTTAPDDNASRGQLSVNQTNSAAWAAVLDGVMVLTNNAKSPFTNIDITQANPVNGNLVQYLISSINAQRIAVGGTFNSAGQLFSTPALTMASPYINTNGAYYNDTNLTDAVFERIPQQIASLVRLGTPRYEIYAYGQSLKPADKSIVQSGQFFGMPTNYQITGEMLTRTVVRFDNMPVPGQKPPGTVIAYALPIQGTSPTNYAIVTNTIPPMRAVVESFEILGPDQ